MYRTFVYVRRASVTLIVKYHSGWAEWAVVVLLVLILAQHVKFW
jgi:hypothetical protein